MPDPGRRNGLTAPPHPRSKRSDAEGNRARIVEIASAAFACSPDATLQSIAKAAGVGQGTMYRHFPSREALLLTVYRAEVDALVQAAPRLLAEHESLRALRLWFGRLAAYGRVKQGASQALEAATRADLGSRSYPQVAAALDQLLGACEAAAPLRPGTNADEVLLLVSFLWKVDDGPDWHERTDRMLSIVVDGLRGTAPHV
ncbi:MULTISPECIES: TetR/AcrR family transcriptional regulator [unclassified Streptomyces]|uniref:TetR/AcrR family transcriptional regulator n=1 Tax=unclassified Streptomyces TaxID=2593676 RepID=UPI000DBA5010|nr:MULTISPECIES: TetR/AcrR family transcriptional regulator [unclassified Streptomyces]MYT75257.1 TetR family transcriptional regulator [Streptomyces sp. SID8367]RAJ77213.1 TetR family transcriptional regulator [Streptomyces sp. PsTaAH-137]